MDDVASLFLEMLADLPNQHLQLKLAKGERRLRARDPLCREEKLR